MIILIPMGGKGERFVNAGYKLNKACIETTDRHSGTKYPMIVCAMKDIPGSDDSENTIVCVNRKLHQTNGTEDIILKQYPNTIFIHDHVMLDQAFGCFLAREYLNSEESLFIGACDSGMDIDLESFDQLKKSSDAIMISHSNCSSTLINPEAHSWAILDSNSPEIKKISLKKTISSNPSKDHATTGMFWFKNSNTFLHYLEEMIWKKDMLDGKYYVDKLLQYYIDDQKKVNYIDVNYISWGTPVDFENYEKTLSYWSKFYMEENWNPIT
jgi:dTDP-glucose pyrophosphorylase